MRRCLGIEHGVVGAVRPTEVAACVEGMQSIAGALLALAAYGRRPGLGRLVRRSAPSQWSSAGRGVGGQYGDAPMQIPVSSGGGQSVTGGQGCYADVIGVLAPYQFPLVSGKRPGPEVPTQ